MNSVRIGLLLGAAFIVHPCPAQSTAVDSLRALLNNEQLSDTARIDLWNQLSTAYCVHFSKEQADDHAMQALDAAQKVNYARGVFQSYFNLGECAIGLGTFAQAEKYLAQAVVACARLGEGDRLSLAICYRQLGLARWAQSKFDSAAIAYRKAEALALAVNEPGILSGIYVSMSALESQRGHYKNSIDYAVKGLPLWMAPRTFNSGGSAAMAFVFNSFGDYKTSLQYYREATKMLEAQNKGKDPLFYFFMGETYVLAKKYDSARYCFNRTRGTMEKERYNIWYDSRTAELNMANGSVDESIVKLTRALKGFKTINDNNQVMWVLSRLMRADKMAHHNDDAMTHAYELLRMSSATGALQHERDANYMLSTLYEEKHAADSALQYVRQYNYYRDRVDLGQTQQRMAMVKSGFEFERLRASLEKRESQLEQAATQRVYYMIAILMVTAIGIVAFRNVSLRRKSEHQRFTAVQNELLLQKLEDEATRAALQHRATELEMQALRAQMNPHFIFNSLNSIHRYILTNDKTLASEYLTTFSKLIRLILTNSQSPLITLESELEGLLLYLKLESLRFEQRFEYHIAIADGIEPSTLNVPPLILQPYVENAIWHGLMHKPEPGRLDINIESMDEFMYIRISDNGIGRKHAAALSSKSATRNKSLGLKITADRIAHMYGDQPDNVIITINDLVGSDGHGAGTEIVIKIPVIHD